MVLLKNVLQISKKFCKKRGGIITTTTTESRPRCARSAPDPPISAPAIDKGFGAPAGRIWTFNNPKQKWFGNFILGKIAPRSGENFFREKFV